MAVGSESKETKVCYTIQLEVPRDVYRQASHSVSHRYSEFTALHEALSKAWGKQLSAESLPKLPKKGFGRLSEKQVEERRLGLQAYLVQLTAVLNWAVEPHLRAFFEADAWLKERKTRPKSRSDQGGAVGIS